MTNYSTLKSTGAPGFPPGFIIPWGHNSIPAGFLLCNGDPVSRTTYADLFAAIGITYGAGDGDANSGTTFNLPSLDGRQLLFQASGTNDGNGNVGGTAGSATIDPDSHVVLDDQQTITNNITVEGNIVGHALNIGQLPAHSHTVNTNFVLGTNDNSRNTNNIADGGAGAVSTQPSFATSSVGSGETHNHNHNIQVNAANIGGTLSLNYNPITPLFSSTRLRAVIKT